MEAKLTTLTDKQEAVSRTIRLTGIAAHGAGLTRKVSVHFDGHTATESGFIGKDTMQFSKRPFARVSVRTALLLTRFLASLPSCAFPNVRQMFQSNDAMRVLVNDASRNGMIGLQLQPSLSSTDLHQAARSGTSAFVLQPFSQPRIMIGFGAYRLARIEGGLASCVGSNCKIALPYINPYRIRMHFWRGVCYFHLKAHQQVEVFMGLVVPQFGGSDGCAVL